MSDPAVAAQRQQQRQQGLIASLVTLPFRFFGVLCGALLLCILIECVGMHFFWPEQGWRHAQGMLHYELDQLSTHFTRSALVQEPGRTAHRLVEQGYDWLFVKSGLLDWIRDASAQASAGSHRPTKDFRYYIGLVYVNVESYLIAAAYTTLVFLVRLLVLCLTLPLFLMAAFVGVNDGLLANAAAQALHHHRRDDMNAVPINQAFLAARRSVLLISDNKGTDGPMAKHSVDQCHSAHLGRKQIPVFGSLGISQPAGLTF